MRQLLLAVACAAVAGVVGYADEDKKEEKKDAGFPELRKEFMAKYTGAKGDKDAQTSAFKEYAPKFIELAEKSGKDGFDALIFGINIGSMASSPQVKAKAIAAEEGPPRKPQAPERAADGGRHGQARDPAAQGPDGEGRE